MFGLDVAASGAGSSMGSDIHLPDMHPAPSRCHSQRLLSHLGDGAGWSSVGASGIQHIKARYKGAMQPGPVFLPHNTRNYNSLTNAAVLRTSEKN